MSHINYYIIFIYTCFKKNVIRNNRDRKYPKVVQVPFTVFKFDINI